MKKSILIVDGVDISREVIKKSLSPSVKNIKVRVATNAYDAMSKINAEGFDLVITDLMMPNGDGFDLIRMMANHSVKSKLVIISGLDNTIVRSAGMLAELYNLNVVASLVKPVWPDQMEKLVASCLSEKEICSEGNKEIVFDIFRDQLPIHLLYQPQVISRKNTITGFEVLPRWIDGNGSMLPLSSFLPEIDEIGKQKRFCSIVIDRFRNDYKRYFCMLDKSIRFSINIDPFLLMDGDVVNHLLSFYEQGAVEHTIVLELKEKHIKDGFQSEQATSILKLRSVGFEISIDDFGSNLANLGNIINLPINEIKIDRKMTWKFIGNTDGLKTDNDVKTLASVNNFRVVYEGIDDEKTSLALHAINDNGGCIQQGYLHGVPLTPREAVKKIEELTIVNKVIKSEALSCMVT
ncbi:EAL domain-containing protein [Vibrio sp. YMD68]|uniref:EAL domain-containing response regulator n=1 Tax=Vibrio sp. YMD68 TaxID=3042300 RepID=UPI00249AB770|nr:EAL domain-containing protein [Vibrio sp. YMD68]WGV98025.1 EAL domain-containing protein [Vibrio sp. YMD68]